MSIQALADIVNIEYFQIRIERGLINTSIGIVNELLAKALKTDIKDLFDFTIE